VSGALWLMIAAFVAIALLRAPIGLAMIAGCIAYLGVTGRDMGLVAEQILNSLFGSFVLIAVPMFSASTGSRTRSWAGSAAGSRTSTSSRA